MSTAWLTRRRAPAATLAGLIIEFTTDPDELTALVTESLTRGFTSGECERFGIDPCPTIEEIREG